MKESARFNLAMTFVNLIIIFFVIIYGGTFVKPEHWTPFLPYGMNGAWAGVGTVFFSYIGFDSVSTLAGEVRRPDRDLPIGIVGTLLIVSTLYVGVSLVITGLYYNALSLLFRNGFLSGFEP
jgi:APA family basic amino acid/polyamine antiporter